MLISVITPVYNEEEYLSACIESVLQQKYSDFELLLIDDGSTDSSPEICEKYKLKDKRIKVFYQENKGVSCARNTGLQNAKGEWITFLDSDDELLPGFLSGMVSDILNNQDVDAIYQNAIHRTKSGDESLYAIRDELLTVRDLYLKYAVSTLGYAHSKFYRAYTIRNHQLQFDTNIFFAEDCLFMVKYLTVSKNIFLSNRMNYIYYDRVDSLVTKKYPFVKEQYLYCTMRKALENLLKKNSLPVLLRVRELEYPLWRLIESNSKIFDTSVRLANYEQLINESAHGFVNLVHKRKWKYNRVRDSLDLELPEFLDEVVQQEMKRNQLV